MRKLRNLCLAFIVFIIGPSGASAAPQIFTDATAFMNAIGQNFSENFDHSAWDGVRTVGANIQAAASVTSQAITWSTNDRITTSQDPSRSGWAVWSYLHGTPDNLIGTSPSTLYGVAGWFKTNTPPAKIHLILDQSTVVDFNDPVIGTQHVFLGVIDPAGFKTFEFQEVEGTVNDQKYIFADDFTFATTLDGPPPNQAPAASAGPDQTVTEGALVTLDGTGSSDPDPGDDIAAFHWAQIPAASVTLSNASLPNPQLTAPTVTAAGVALVFELTVTDSQGLESTDRVTVNVVDSSGGNSPPTADAGADQAVLEGSRLTLDGSGSVDPEGDPLTPSWRQVSGPSVTLSDSASLEPFCMTPPVVPPSAALVFELTVRDAAGLSATDTVSVVVSDNGITGFPANALTLTTVTGQDIAVRMGTGGQLIDLWPSDPSDIDATANPPASMIYGLLNFRIKTTVPGGSANLTVLLPQAADAGAAWYKYIQNDWFDFSANAAFSSDRKQVTLTLTDGGAGDDDGDNTNGVIVDPSGLGTASGNSGGGGNGSGGGGGGGCFVASLPEP